MIVLSNTTAQVIPAGGSLVFDKVVLHRGCAECHRSNTGDVKLRKKGLFEVHFSANIGATTEAEDSTLAIMLGGVRLPETTMNSVNVAAGDINNVATNTIVSNCCGDYDRISVMNVGTTTVNVGENPSLVVHEL